MQGVRSVERDGVLDRHLPEVREGAESGDRAMTTAEFHAKRLTGLGGSDAGVLAGSPYKTPYTLFMEKTGRHREDRDSEAMYWGRILEEPVARRYCEVTGRKVRRQPMLRHKTHDWMIANVDRQIVGDHRGPGVLEVKTSGAFGVTVGDEGDLPDHYYAQLQHYLMVTGYTWGAFAWLVGGQTFRTFEVTADTEYHAELFRIEREFWQRVLDNDPPPVEAGDAEALKGVFRSDAGTTITIEREELTLAAAQLVEVKATLKTLEEQKKLLEARLKVEMGDAAVMQLPGFGRITWKSAKPTVRTTLDEEALKADGIYDKYARTVEVPGSRRFLLYPEKAS